MLVSRLVIYKRRKPSTRLVSIRLDTAPAYSTGADPCSDPSISRQAQYGTSLAGAELSCSALRRFFVGRAHWPCISID